MTEQMHIAAVEPTVFFVRDRERLRQRVCLRIEGTGDQLALSIRGEGVDDLLPLIPDDETPGSYAVYLPDLRQPARLTLGLHANGALCDEQSIDWQPQKHWEVYLVHYSHHDLGYTDLPTNVLREHVEILDDVLRYCDETRDWSEDTRFRWLVEQAWSIVEFLETRPREAVERMIAAIRRGQIEVTALFANMTSELCGHEQLIRLLYPSFRLQREYGIEITSAEHNDIPGFCWGLANVLAGAGVRYFSPGVPRWYFGQGEKQVHPLWDEAQVLDLARPGAFWWQGIDGSQLLLWYDLHGGEWYPTSYEHALRELPGMLKGLDEHDFPYDMVSYTLRGGHRDNAPAIDRYAHIARQWNSRWAYPRLINATNEQFLSRFEQRWGASLWSLRGDVPGTDYAVAATCTPRETALNRNAHDGLLAAEKLATLCSLVADYAYPRATLDRAYRNTFYFDEHCWGFHHPGGPAHDGDFSEKGGFAYRAATLAHDVTIKAANRIADGICYSKEGTYLTLFNSLSWPRTTPVRIALQDWQPCGLVMHCEEPKQPDEGASLVCGGAIGRNLVAAPEAFLDKPFDLVDVETGQTVPYQLTRVSDPQAAQPWAAERVAYGLVQPRQTADLTFLAEDLPALGYRTYRLVPREQSLQPVVEHKASAHMVENRFYRLEMDPQSGTIASLIDKDLNCEMVDRAAPHRFAQFIARRCQTGQEELGRATGVTIAEDGPISTTLRIKGSVLGCPAWTQEITLYHRVKRIDVNLRFLRDSTPNLEHYLAFPFQVESPRFRYEATDTVIEPLRDQVPGSNTDYYAVQHWAEIYNDTWGITWAPIDAPIVEFGGLWPGYVSGAHHGVTPPGYGHPFLQPGELTRSHIYSMLMYANFRTNFINVHTGEALLRYAFRSDPRPQNEAQVRQFGWDAANPPVAVWMEGPTPGTLAPTASFCQADAPNVMLLTLKRAEDGQGLILRLIETEGREAEATVTLPGLRIVHAYATNLVEENQQLLPYTAHSVRAHLKPYGIATVRLLGSWTG